MTHEEKINYMRIAANICKFGFTYEHLDLLVWLYEAVTSNGGELTLKDITDIEHNCAEAAKVKARQELLDKVSEKV